MQRGDWFGKLLGVFLLAEGASATVTPSWDPRDFECVLGALGHQTVLEWNGSRFLPTDSDRALERLRQALTTVAARIRQLEPIVIGASTPAEATTFRELLDVDRRLGFYRRYRDATARGDAGAAERRAILDELVASYPDVAPAVHEARLRDVATVIPNLEELLRSAYFSALHTIAGPRIGLTIRMEPEGAAAHVREAQTAPERLRLLHAVHVGLDEAAIALETLVVGLRLADFRTRWPIRPRAGRLIAESEAFRGRLGLRVIGLHRTFDELRDERTRRARRRRETGNPDFELPRIDGRIARLAGLIEALTGFLTAANTELLNE